MVVYENLLFSAVSVQAGGQDKIPAVRQETNSLLFSFVKGSGISVKCQSGEAPKRRESVWGPSFNRSFDLLRLFSARLANHILYVTVKPGSEEEMSCVLCIFIF
jgi:hypothetical protein